MIGNVIIARKLMLVRNVGLKIVKLTFIMHVQLVKKYSIISLENNYLGMVFIFNNILIFSIYIL